MPVWNALSTLIQKLDVKLDEIQTDRITLIISNIDNILHVV